MRPASQAREAGLGTTASCGVSHTDATFSRRVGRVEEGDDGCAHDDAEGSDRVDEREGGGEDEAVGQDLHELHVGERHPAHGGEVSGGGEAGGQGARGRVWQGGGQSRASPAAQLVGHGGVRRSQLGELVLQAHLHGDGVAARHGGACHGGAEQPCCDGAVHQHREPADDGVVAETRLEQHLTLLARVGVAGGSSWN